MKNSNNSVNRRRFLQNAVLIATTAGLSARVGAQPGLTPLEENDPLALALGYKKDATTVDVAKYPKRAGAAGAKQFCSGCTLYTEHGSSGQGACTATPGRSVAGAGWCNVWAPKA